MSKRRASRVKFGELHDELRAAGWTKLRESKHVIWARGQLRFALPRASGSEHVSGNVLASWRHAQRLQQRAALTRKP